MRSRSPNSNHLLRLCKKVYSFKSGDIPSIGSRDIVDTRICHADADAENLSLRPPVTLKIESESLKLNQLFGLSQ